MDHAVDIVQNASDVGRSMNTSGRGMSVRRHPRLGRRGESTKSPQVVQGNASDGDREVDDPDCDTEEKDREERQELLSRRLDVEAGFWSVVTNGWLGQAFCISKFRTPFRALQYRRRRMVPLEWPLVGFQLGGILLWTVMMLAEDYDYEYGSTPGTLRAVILAQWMHSQSVIAMIFVVLLGCTSSREPRFMSFSWVTTFWSFGFFWLASTCYGTESAERRDDGPAATNVTDIDYGKGNGERGGEVEWGVYAVNVLNDGRDPRNIVVTVWCLSIVCCHIWLPIYTAAVVSTRAQHWRVLSPAMMAALPKTMYGAAYLLITAVDCCREIWASDVDLEATLRVRAVFATVNAQAQSIGAFIFAGASLMMFRERGILNLRLFLNLQWSIFPEWLLITSVVAWGFSCILQVERGEPILPNGRCMLGVYMYMNLIIVCLVTTNKSRAEQVRKLEAEEEGKVADLDEEVGRYEEFLFECRHNFACLNPAYDCKNVEANGGNLVLLPRSTHPEFHLIFDAIRGSDFIDDGKSFRLTLASHPGKALVVTDAAKPKGGEFVILGDASDALEVSTVRGSNHRSEGVYVATTANPDLVLHFPHSDIYSFAPVILASRASTLEEKGNGQFILNEDGTISTEHQPTFVLAWDPVNETDTPAAAPALSSAGASASARMDSVPPVSTTDEPSSVGIELAVFVDGQREEASTEGTNEPRGNSQTCKAAPHENSEVSAQQPPFDPHKVVQVAAEDQAVLSEPRCYVENPLHDNTARVV